MLIFSHKFGIRMQCVIRDQLHRSRQKSHFLQIQGLGMKECLCDLQKCVLPKKNEFLSLLYTRRIFSWEKKLRRKNKYFRTACQCPCSCSTLLLPSSALTLASAFILSFYPSSSAASQGRASASVWCTRLQSPTQGEFSPGAHSGSGFRGESLQN